MFYSSEYASPLGTMLLASDGSHLVGAWMAGQKYFGAGVPAAPTRADALPVFSGAKHWLDAYFAGGRPDLSDLPLAPRGGAFRQLVWALLREIPHGGTTTYGQLAQAVAARLGRATMSSQAVGGAVGHNPISIIIPCHRVVGSDGSLTGYAGGLERKIRLLEGEGVGIVRLPAGGKGGARDGGERVLARVQRATHEPLAR